MAGTESGQEGKCDTRITADTLNNHEIKLYFLFLHSTITECEKVNAALQTDPCHPEKLCNFLHQLHQSIRFPGLQ